MLKKARKDAQTRAKLDDENVNGFDKFGIRVGSGLNNIGTNIASMPGYVGEVVGQNINNAFSGRNTAVNLDSSASRAMERAGEYAQTALHGTEGVTRFLGESALSIGNNLAVLALSGGIPAIAAPLMGLQAGANTAYDIAQRGGTGFQQLAGGALSGIAEGVGERISLGGLKRIINNPATRSTALGVVKQIGAQALTEFTEEAATEVMNIVSDAAVMQDKAQLAQFFSEYVEAHPGKEGEAMALVAAQFVQQMTLSGLQGAISGGVMGGGATTYAGIQNRGQGRGAGRTVQAGAVAQGAVTPQALPIAPAAQSAAPAPQDILAELNGPVAQGAAAQSAAPAPQDILAELNGPVAQGAAAQSAGNSPQDILAALNGPVAQGAAARNGTAPQALPIVPALQSIAAPSPQDILAALNGPVAQGAGAELQSRLAELNGPVAQGAVARNGTAPQALPIVPTLNKMIDFDGEYFTMGNEGSGNKPKVSDKGSATKWTNPDGSTKWPPNNGAVPGTERVANMKIGETFGRIGNNKGSYVAPPGTSSEKLSLKPGTDISIYKEYKVIKEIPNVEQATVSPWFDMPGGGTQYKMPMSIEKLLKGEYIVPLN